MKSRSLIIPDPIHDPRWSNLVARHPSASIFHTPAWLDALHRTYGYEPVVVTTSSGPVIDNGLVACRVRGFGTSRVVSLPFSDHCEPLVSDAAELPELVNGLVELAATRGWGRVELRPRSAGPGLAAAAPPCSPRPSLTPAAAAPPRSPQPSLTPGRTYCLHELDLRPEAAQIFAGFHHSSTQRAIRRAEREGVTCEVGASDAHLSAFFGLLRMARRRHGLPPQPMTWFRNLRSTMGNSFALHVARHGGQPIAALLTLSFRDTVVYKYGGSDASRHSLGAMPFLFWHAIQAAKTTGATTLDLGRSDLDQPGLIAFKDHLGARQSALTYYGQAGRHVTVPGQAWVSRTAGRIVSALPDTALDLAGRLLYRHLG